MTVAFDDRLIQFQVTVEERTYVYDQSYYIIASGARYNNGNFGECAIRIDNIAKEARDFIISKTTPWAKKRSNAQVVLSVGRKSYGMFELFRGDMIGANVTQPPDIGLIFKSAVSAAMMGYTNAFSAPPTSTLKFICQQVVNNWNSATPAQQIVLDFQSEQGSKTIGNFSFSGPVPNQIRKLEDLAAITAHVENGKLVVMDVGKPRNVPSVLISSETGMIGVPEITDIGVRVRCLLINNIVLGTPIKLVSTQNKQANGDFYVFKLQFEIASRDTPFYWVMDLTPSNTALGYQQ